MYYSDLPSDIPTDEDVLAMIEKINKEGTPVNIQPAAIVNNQGKHQILISKSKIYKWIPVFAGMVVWH